MLVNNRMAGGNPRLTRDSGAGGEDKGHELALGDSVCVHINEY